MKTTLTLALALVLVAAGSVSWASTKLNSFTSRLVFENNLVNSAGAATKKLESATLSNAANMPPQTIKICTQTIPAGGTGFPFSWANGGGSLPSFSLNDTQCNVMDMTGKDHYNKYTENVPPGWTLTNISCTSTTTPIKIIGANSNPGFEPGDNTVTMDLNEQNVTCTFVNQLNPKCCYYRQHISTGQSGPVDPLWKVNGLPAYTTPKVSTWMALPSAQWIQPKPLPTPSGSVGGGLYTYTLRFNVPPCPTGGVQLIGSFAADNSAVAKLDGIPIPGASCPGPICFNTPQAPVSLSGAPLITPGWHILEIDVTNNGDGYSGLIVNAQLKRQCP